MIIKSKRNKVIDRRLIPGNWLMCIYPHCWGYGLVTPGTVLYPWLWLRTLKATGSYTQHGSLYGYAGILASVY